jgi:hypothetical protein
VRSGDHFLPGVAPFVECDRVQRIEIQHLRYEFLGRGRGHLRLSSRDFES